MPTPPELQYILDNGVTLTVYTTKNPLWHGDYEGGKLAVYEAKQSGEKIFPEAIAILAVYNSEHCEPITVAAIYNKYSSIDSIIGNVLYQVKTAMINAVMINKKQEVSDGQHRYLH